MRVYVKYNKQYEYLKYMIVKFNHFIYQKKLYAR